MNLFGYKWNLIVIYNNYKIITGYWFNYYFDLIKLHCKHGYRISGFRGVWRENLKSSF